MSFITIWTLINFILLGVGIYISVLLIKALRIYIKKTNRKLYYWYSKI